MSTTPCQVCAATQRQPFAQPQDPRFGTMALWRCENCGFVYLDPMPGPEELAVLYDSDTSLGYFAKADQKLARSRRRVRQMTRYVAGGRFLDVGCNGGFMVEAARQAGFAAQGLDPDPASIRWARDRFPDNQFQIGTLEEFAGAGASPFDAVYCSEVIEHSPDCNAFMKALTGLMRPRAVLYLTTPDLGHWRRPRALDDWDAFKPPEHCLYFSRGNLALLLERHGLTILRRRIAFKPGIKVFARITDRPD